MVSIVERWLPAAAWTCILFIAFATLSPIELRPVAAGVRTEHIVAFAVLAMLFGLAYPRHAVVIAILIFGAAVLLESLQLIVPGRHGRAVDVLQKCGGAGVGAIAAYMINRHRRFWHRPS